jgi:DNA-binding ferritin-like protein
MNKKKITESFHMMLTVEPNLHIITENMMAEWGNISYSQLSVILVHLKFLAELHQHHHWTCMGDPFYGDHLLFQRLYDGVSGEIDSVAEKVIGLGCTSNVNMQIVQSQILKLVSNVGSGMTIPQSNDLAKRSMIAEMNFLKVIDYAMSSLDECGMLSNGVDNLLQGIADKHEGHVYLLKQRCSKQAV